MSRIDFGRSVLMMTGRFSTVRGVLATGMVLASQLALAAFNSGSTGADGAFSPTQSQTVQLPPNGIFNFTDVNIPAGVTIKFAKNAANTPVTILASGDVTIAGTIDVSATPPADPSNFSGPGQGGPGGYDGGRGGQAGGDASNWVNGLTGANIGRNGVGPGGGAPGKVYRPNVWSNYWGTGAPAIGAGGGGSYGFASAGPGGDCPVTSGTTYGNVSLLPLVGGSGGGGGVGGSNYPGSGGGGGGGAILIAASGTINVTGAVLANGGLALTTSVAGRGTPGGSGSGGAIRLVATTIRGDGTLRAAGGGEVSQDWYDITNAGSRYYICSTNHSNYSSSGGAGRIRLESENLLRTTGTAPYYVGGAPGLLFVPNSPALSIASIGGLPVPATPTGNGDVSLPPEVSNPVTVVLKTSGVTVGSTIKLTVAPAVGAAYSATSAPTTGTTDNATATVSIDIPSGQSILQASVTYTVVAAVGDAMSVYAQGERVEKVRLISTLGGSSMATLITISGKEYEVPASRLARVQG